MAKSPTAVALGFAPNAPVNLSLACSVAGSALTIAIKQADGTDPTQYSPAFIPVRSVTAANGDVSWVAVTAATSLVISNGSTLGTTLNIANRFWIVAFLDAGVLRVGAVNALSGTNIMALGAWGIDSSTAEGGAGAADSAQVFYTGTAVTSKPYSLLGYLTYEAGLATAGVYTAAPTRVQTFGPGVPLAGQVVQVQMNETGATATGTTTTPNDDTIPQVGEGTQFLAQSITPSSAANLLDLDFKGLFSSGTTTTNGTCHLHKDGAANAIAAGQTVLSPNASTDSMTTLTIRHRRLAGTTVAQAYTFRAGGSAGETLRINGRATAAARSFGGTANSYGRAEEIMA
jgi:hypothetical protein